jgi:hypothetical protein
MRRCGRARTYHRSVDRERLLLPDEEVVFVTRRHVVVVMGPLFGALVALVAASALGLVTSPGVGDTAIDLAAGVTAALVTLRAAVKLLAWYRDTLTVTDRRVLRASGLLRTRVESLPLRSIAEVVYRRSVRGRLLGYGDLELVTGPEGPALYLDRLPRPRRCYLALAELLAPSERPPLVLPPDADDTGPLPRVVV